MFSICDVEVVTLQCSGNKEPFTLITGSGKHSQGQQVNNLGQLLLLRRAGHASFTGTAAPARSSGAQGRERARRTVTAAL